MSRVCWFAVFLVLIMAGEAVAHPPWDIGIDKERRIFYFSDLERVWKIDAKGNRTVFLEDVHTHKLHVDGEGNVHGEYYGQIGDSNSFRFRYWKATPDGVVEEVSESEAVVFFDRWDSSGNRYKLSSTRSEATITRTTPDEETSLFAGGEFGYADGKGADARLRLFGDSVWGLDNCLYFTNGGLVRKLELDGTVTTVAGPEHGFAHSIQEDGSPVASRLLGIDVEHDGGIVFADIRQHKVFRLTSDGEIETAFDSGEDWYPSGVACVGDLLYILEHPDDFPSQSTTPRIRVLASDGTFRDLEASDPTPR